MSTRVRIAPSPTGDPHVGTAYMGLLNYIFAHQRGGQFILRIEDTDRTRFVSTSEQMIFDSLRWLGLDWNEGPDVGGPFGPYRQSERTEIYREHVDKLLTTGAAYRCFCTPEELDAARKRQLTAKLPPRYEGTCRRLTPDQIKSYLHAAKPFTIRMVVPYEGETTFRDELRGPITFSHNNVDDQVLMKSDGFPTYHLANVVDDHLMQISDVIRAEEWISSTPKHVLLYQAFSWDPPKFWHMPLLRNTDKSKISKRKNPVSLNYYRDSGYLPNALLNFLGLMGGGMPAGTEKGTEAEIFSLPQMLEKFDFAKISLGGPVFDLVKLKWLNGEYLRALTPDQFAATLRNSLFSDDFLRRVTPLVQTRIDTLAQFGDLANFLISDEVLPPESVWLPKNHSSEATLALCDRLLVRLESTEWTASNIESAVQSTRQFEVVFAFLPSIENANTRATYKTAIQNFLDYLNDDRFGLGAASTKGNEYESWLIEQNYEKSTVATYVSAIRSLASYIETNGGDWSVKDIFMLLRTILTGSTASPPLVDSMIVFGKARSLDRMRRFLETQKKQRG